MARRGFALLAALALSSALPGYTQVPQAGWPVTYATPFVTTVPNVADLDGDGLLEVIVHADPAGVFVFRHDGSLMPGWPYHTTGQEYWMCQPFQRPLVADIDGDGAVELVYLTKYLDRIVALSPTAQVKPGFPVANAGFGGQSFLALGDLTGDGVVELVVNGYPYPLANGTRQTTFFALDGLGNPVPGFPSVVNWGGPLFMQTTAFAIPHTVADIDFDGRAEIIANVNFYDANQNEMPTPVVVLQGDGTVRPGWPVYPPSQTYGGGLFEALVADLHQDYQPEIVIPGQHDVNTLGPDGQLAGPMVVVPLVIPNDISFNQNALGDLDGDGSIEGVFGGSNTLVRWDPELPPAQQFLVTTGPYVGYRAISLADIDGDGDSEIACWTISLGGVGQHAVHLLDHNLNELPGWPQLLTPYYVPAHSEYATIFADLDADGGLELIYANGGTVYVWDLPRTGPGPVRVEWGNNRHDAAGSNFHGEVPDPAYLRGDANRNGHLEVADAVKVLGHVILGQPHACAAQLDFNEDASVNLIDAIAELGYLFGYGSATPITNFPVCTTAPRGPIACQEFECR